MPATRLHLSATTLWKHYVQPSERSIPGDDSAEFSANVAVPVLETPFSLKFSYTFEAFREDYVGHRGQIYVEGPLWRE